MNIANELDTFLSVDYMQLGTNNDIFSQYKFI